MRSEPDLIGTKAREARPLKVVTITFIPVGDLRIANYLDSLMKRGGLVPSNPYSSKIFFGVLWRHSLAPVSVTR